MERRDSSEPNKTEKNNKISDKKAVIKNADMSEDMQQDAVDCATQALEKYNIEKDIAAYIKKEFDQKKPTQYGMLLLDITLEAMSHMKPSTCLTSILDKWLSHMFTPWKD